MITISQCHTVTISMEAAHCDAGVEVFKAAPGVFHAELTGDTAISVYVKPDDHSVNSFADWIEGTMPCQ